MDAERLKDSLEARHRTAASDSRDVFAKALSFDTVDQMRTMGLYPFFRAIELNEGPEAIVDGKRVLMFGSNNYLGLTTHPHVRAAASEAVLRYGTSLTGSRLLNGTLDLHRQLEASLAAFLGKEACLVFSTGYQVNLGVIQALVGKGAALALDHRSHASLFDAARMADGEIFFFRHADPGHLDHLLGNMKVTEGVLVALEGVFSMEGEVIDLPAFLAVAEKHGTRVMLDDAHGIGVHGRGGRGTAELHGVADRIDLILGTFSKSLASVGGFVAGPAKVIDYIQHFSRSFVFTASLPPASIAAAAAALEILVAEPQLVDRLQANVVRYREALRRQGFTIGKEATPVVPIVIGDEVLAFRVWRDLLDSGLYVNVAVPPAVPRNKALLRTSVMATHAPEQLDAAVEILGATARRLGVLPVKA